MSPPVAELVGQMFATPQVDRQLLPVAVDPGTKKVWLNTFGSAKGFSLLTNILAQRTRGVTQSSMGAHVEMLNLAVKLCGEELGHHITFGSLPIS